MKIVEGNVISETSGDFDEIVHILSSNSKSINRLSLMYDIRVNKAKKLFDALKTNKTLVWLDINPGSTIGDEGAFALAEALQTNRALEFVGLDATGI